MTHTTRTYLRFLIFSLVTGAAAIGIWFQVNRSREAEEERHFVNDETEVRIANAARAELSLFKAGSHLADSRQIPFSGSSLWLPIGRYYIRGEIDGQSLFYPLPLTGYRSGRDDDDSFTITVRPPPREVPPLLLTSQAPFAHIPSGWFAFGDKQNPNEEQEIWLSAFFVASFEVTNEEFRTFIDADDGYARDSNWSAEGLQWKAENRSGATASLSSSHQDYPRFGADDLPVTWVNWHEATAYCSWITRKIGEGKWIFRLPTEQEWEKTARGPDTFDYGLGMNVSDDESKLYNWRKNADAPVTVLDFKKSAQLYSPNRYGVFHMSGNVTEWTESTPSFSTSSRGPRAAAGNRSQELRRVIRGGSWYSASTATLYIPFRDSFQPEHSTQEVGFRIVARRLP